MWKSFGNIDDLLAEVRNDKVSTGPTAAQRNRYPVRFVLFDSFADSRDFINAMYSSEGHDFMLKNSDEWIEKEEPDVLITHSRLEKLIEELVATLEKDCVLTPFSEMIRFYNNRGRQEFDALIRTLKSIESRRYNGNVPRLYIPLVGMEGKMHKFRGASS